MARPTPSAAPSSPPPTGSWPGTPHSSNGRLNVSQLAIEASVKWWHLTHQHTDLRERFQAEAHARTTRVAALRSADDYEDLKRKTLSSANTPATWRVA